MKTQRHFKKITALLLVLILAVSSFAFPASAAKYNELNYNGGYTTMQLLNSAGWSKIYMHAVNADGDELSGVFPGIEVKEIFLDRIGRKVYIAVIPEEVTEIYFNDGGSNRTDVITDFKNGSYKILSQRDGQDYCELMLDADYGEGKPFGSKSMTDGIRRLLLLRTRIVILFLIHPLISLHIKHTNIPTTAGIIC